MMTIFTAETQRTQRLRKESLRPLRLCGATFESKNALVICDGELVDGTGAPARRANILIRDGRIVDIGSWIPPPNVDAIDARGLVVAPGFIDIHSHSDWTLLADPRAVSSIIQGVTLEVVGNCGHGCAPLGDRAVGAGNIYGYQAGAALDWDSTAGYLERLEAARPAVNVLALVPNGCLRLAVLGLADRPATPRELERMKTLLEQGLQAGAWGFSTGLDYAAEHACGEDELGALCAVTAAYDGLYATHTRNRLGQPAAAIDEALRTAARSGVRLQISHIGVVARLVRDSRAAIEGALEQVDRAQRGGLDAGFDMHTRLFGTTNLSAALPPWALAGDRAAIAARLRDPRARRAIKRFPSIVAALADGDWQRIVLFNSPAHPALARLSIAEIGRRRSSQPLDTVLDLLLDNVDDLHAAMIIAFTYREDDVRIVWEQPDCMPGSDATALATDGPLAHMTFHGAYTWAAWFWSHFVRETKLLSVPEAIRRLTSLPAGRLGLGDRGVVRLGARADVAIFDPQHFAARGTTWEPNQPAVGMRFVLVNGVVSVRDGELTGARGGQVLRKSG